MKEENTNSNDEVDSPALVRRVLAGETEAYAELVNSCKREVFAMIMRQVGDEVVAEEISQEAFFKAYRGLKKFKQEASFSTWVIRIALNESNSYFRSKRYKQKLLSEELSNNLPQEEDTSAQKEYQHQLLRQCLATLKPKYRDVITLHSLEGKSYAEIADVLQIPSGTVGSRMNQAMKILRKKMSRLAQ